MNDLATRTDPVHPSTAEAGFFLPGLIAILVPALALAIAATATMTGRNTRLLSDVHRARAQLAAEAGIDAAIYRAKTGALTPGTPFSIDMGSGVSFLAEPADWSSDGDDNDGDGAVDEADEDVLGVVVTGTYRTVAQRLAVSFTLNPQRFPGALYLGGSGTTLQAQLTPIDGDDKNIDGSTPSPTFDTIGVRVPNVGAFVAGLDAQTQSCIDGIASTSPDCGGLSVDTPASALDIPALVAHAQANANLVLPPGDFSGSFGDSATNNYPLVICNGDLNLKTGFKGAGVLVVTGKVQGQQWQSFHGLLVVLGDIQMQDCPITGALLAGPSCPAIQMQGTTKVQYSTQVLDELVAKLPTDWLGGGGGAGGFTFRAWHPYAR